MSAELRLWRIGPDTVIAHDEADAFAVWSEHCGERIEDYEREGAEPIDDTKPFTIVDDDTPQRDCPLGCATWAVTDLAHAIDRTGHHPTCSHAHVTKTAAEWAASNGRGFLCSTEY